MTDSTRGFMTRLILFLVISVGFFASACVEPFSPRIPDRQTDLLVVEGYINAGPGTTRIMLSKVSPLSTASQIFEEGAIVRIESKSGANYAVTERGNGIYESDSLTLPLGDQYRLVIECSNGKTYESEYINTKVTPPIDSVHWKWEGLLKVYVTSHDDQAATQYYSWTFQEDWQIRSQYVITHYYEMIPSDSLVPYYPSDALKLYDCWGKSVSQEIVIASTRQLAADLITYPVATIPAASQKIQTRYSILVRQRAMTEAEYNYTVLVKKNAEQNGSFFDPMPSQLFGNIRCADRPDEVVIGYVAAYTTQQMRLFVRKDELPATPLQEKCDSIDFEYSKANLRAFLSNPSAVLPYKMYYEDGDSTRLRVLALPAVCLDCRLKPGATNTHPGWESEP